MYEIENDIPIPSGRGGRAKNYPEMYDALLKLQTGQSFIMPVKDGTNASALQGTIHSFGKKTGKKFLTRTKRNDGKLEMRVWRIE